MINDHTYKCVGPVEYIDQDYCFADFSIYKVVMDANICNFCFMQPSAPFGLGPMELCEEIARKGLWPVLKDCIRTVPIQCVN